MASGSRWVAILAGVVGAAVSAAFVLREVALAFNAGTVWNMPSWSGWITERPGALRATVAAVVTGLAAAVCVWIVFRLLRRPVAPLRRLELGNEKESLLIDASTLDRFLGKALSRRIPEVDVARVWLHRDDDEAFRARVVVGLCTSCDVLVLQTRVRDLVREELGRATGLEVARLDLQVEKLDVRLKGGS